MILGSLSVIAVRTTEFHSASGKQAVNGPLAKSEARRPLAEGPCALCVKNLTTRQRSYVSCTKRTTQSLGSNRRPGGAAGTNLGRSERFATTLLSVIIATNGFPPPVQPRPMTRSSSILTCRWQAQTCARPREGSRCRGCYRPKQRGGLWHGRTYAQGLPRKSTERLRECQL